MTTSDIPIVMTPPDAVNNTNNPTTDTAVNETFCNEAPIGPTSSSSSHTSGNPLKKDEETTYGTDGNDSASQEEEFRPSKQQQQQQQPERRKNILIFVASSLIVSLFVTIMVWTDRERIHNWMQGGRERPDKKKFNDEYYWPFHDTLTDEGYNKDTLQQIIFPNKTRTLAYGKFGRVFAIDLMEENIVQTAKKKTAGNKNNADDVGVTSMYDYRTILGRLRMQGDEEEGIMCLYRTKAWWLEPFFIHGEEETEGGNIPPETILILGKAEDYDDGIVASTSSEYRIILALILPSSLDRTVDDGRNYFETKKEEGKGFTSCAIQSIPSSSSSESTVALTSETGGTVAIYAGRSKDPYALLQEGAAMAAHLANYQNTDISDNVPFYFPSSNPNNPTTTRHARRLSRLPNFAKYLGWCTWNAFYTSLSGQKIIDGLSTLREAGVPRIGWMIVDDGWQHIESNDAELEDVENDLDARHYLRLKSLGSSPYKFSPDDLSNDSDDEGEGNRHRDLWDANSTLLSFKETMKLLKQPIDDGGEGLDAVLAWHALSGYWMGVEPRTATSEETVAKSNNIPSSISLPLQNPDVTMYYPHLSPGIVDNDPTMIKRVSGGQGSTRGQMGEPTNAADFYDRYYAYMTAVGLDGVKVDAQGVTGFLRSYHPTDIIGNKSMDSNNVVPGVHRHELSTRLHDSLSVSIRQNFNNHNQIGDNSDHDSKDGGIIEGPPTSALPIIHCMCHAPEIIYRIPSLYGSQTIEQKGEGKEESSSPSLPFPLMRASDDFLPNDPSSHRVMITSLAYNSLLLGFLSTPDWDMFQSLPPLPSAGDEDDAPSPHAIAKLHAVARSISGGPIYISDVPGESNPDLLKQVVCDDGTVLPCAGVALPIKEQLLRDPLVNNRTMIVWNVNGLPGDGMSWKFSRRYEDSDDSNTNYEDDTNTIVTSGVLGLFHLGHGGGGDTTITVRPQQVEAFQQQYLLGDYQKTYFFAHSYNSRHAWILDSISDEVDIHIPPENEGGGQLWCDVVSMIPITVLPMSSRGELSLRVFDIVPMGLLDKFNGPGSVLRLRSSVVEAPFAVTGRDNSQQEAVAAKIDLSVRGCGQFAVLARVRYQTSNEWYHSGMRAVVTVDNERLDRVDVVRLWDEDRMADDLPRFQKPITGLEKEGFSMIKFELPPSATKLEAEEERWVSIEIALK